MKIILIQSLLFSILSFTAHCLHLQTQEAIYDPDLYLQSLTTTQTKLSSDLKNIQSIFKSLDSAIQNATNDPNQQLRLYQQGIADQRDSLYSIQQYLNLPYGQRSCQCFNFTDDMRANFSQQLINVQQKLANLESQAQKCDDCGITQQIQNEIKIQKSYLSIMNDTINSKCCKVYQIIYVDNLTASNWMNGGWSPQQYQTWMAQQVQSAIANNTNNNNSNNGTQVRTCPLQTPYTSANLSDCTQCQSQNQLFNIKTRQCGQCASNQIFNYLTHNCDYNIICPSGSMLNQNTLMCQKIYPAINASWCPPDTPVWNPQLLGCFKCNTQTPYYDTYSGTCIACPSNTTYNPSVNQCINSNCQVDQIFNPITQLCQPRQISNTTQEGSSSQCPPDRPYWDKTSLSCSLCPTTLPYYNPLSKNCEVCPTNSSYDQIQKKCVFLCPTGQQYNTTTLVCQNITTVQPTDSLNSLCPLDRPIWNPDSKSCTQCSLNMPYWNSNIGQCQICPINQAWNTTTNSCQIQTQEITCSPGTVFNALTGFCDLLNGSIAFCPPDKPYYNSLILGCTQCPPTLPYYNQSTGQCQIQSYQSNQTSQINPTQNFTIVCPSGSYYDPLTQQCFLINSNITIIQCPPTIPLWNSLTGTCQPCPSGTTWNLTIRACIPCLIPSLCPLVQSQNSTTCDYNYQWSNITGACRKCLPYQKFNNVTKLCDSICRLGEVYDSTLGICSGTISNCPVGLVYQVNQMLCICPQGVSYKYYPQLNQCSQYCTAGQQYNYLTQSCSSIS